jgi:hypothetical protein
MFSQSFYRLHIILIVIIIFFVAIAELLFSPCVCKGRNNEKGIVQIWPRSTVDIAAQFQHRTNLRHFEQSSFSVEEFLAGFCTHSPLAAHPFPQLTFAGWKDPLTKAGFG